MHMSDALVSAAVGTAMGAVSAGTIGYSIRKIRVTEMNDNRIPMMGVLGAFIFSAQMINFTIPGTGSSGHIGGGILLAALLGPYPAFITLTSVLIIQALFFADGGLLALGCNIFNMGVLPCLVAYPLIYRRIVKKKLTQGRITLGSILSVIIGLQLGAFAVVIETMLSGVTKLPFGTFLALMQPIHLAIGAVEGVVTGAVLCFIYRVRKEILTNALEKENMVGVSTRKFLIGFCIAAILTGGILSYYASSKPDGLQWAIQEVIGDSNLQNTTETQQEAKKLQEKTAILPGYKFKEEQNNQPGTGVAGILGGGITLTATIVSAFLILKWKKSRSARTVSDKDNDK